MRVLVIGGTRFIGPQVVKQLVVRGCDVTVFHRGNTPADGEKGRPLLPPGAGVIHGDRRALGRELIERLRAARPEVVIDMCCLAEADAGPLLDLFAGQARRYVLVSSCDVYRAYGVLIGRETGEPAIEPTPLTEDSPLRRALYPYRGEEPRAEVDPQRILDDYDKIPAERLVLDHPGLEGAVVRLPMVYGPGDYQRRLRQYVQQMQSCAAEITLSESLAGWRDCRGYVVDVAHGIVLAAMLEEAAGRIYNVAEQDSTGQLDWLGRIARAAGWGGRIRVVLDSELPEDQRPDFNCAQDLSVDSSRIRSELGYLEITDPAEALRLSIEWERAQQ